MILLVIALAAFCMLVLLAGWFVCKPIREAKRAVRHVREANRRYDAERRRVLGRLPMGADGLQPSEIQKRLDRIWLDGRRETEILANGCDETCPFR